LAQPHKFLDDSIDNPVLSHEVVTRLDAAQPNEEENETETQE
jgi:hypothetical protein